MIALFNSISGIVSRKLINPQNTQFCLETAGIEWIFDASRTTVQTIPEIGRETRVFTYLIHREDAFYFCGFATDAERAMFLDLIKVDGIGPKQALKILGSILHDRLEKLLEAGDLDGLENLPGVGKKTAQKMVLTLKGKLSVEAMADTGRPGQITRIDLGENEDIAVALVAMGYDRKAVAELLMRLAPEFQHLPKAQREQELMRRAIMDLS